MPDMLDQLEALIAERQIHPKAGSYTNSLLESGKPRAAQKVGEEAVEVVIAALGESKKEQVDELADLFYHLLVLMAALDISLDDLRQRLRERHQAP